MTTPITRITCRCGMVRGGTTELEAWKDYAAHLEIHLRLALQACEFTFASTFHATPVQGTTDD